VISSIFDGKFRVCIKSRDRKNRDQESNQENIRDSIRDNIRDKKENIRDKENNRENIRESIQESIQESFRDSQNSENHKEKQFDINFPKVRISTTTGIPKVRLLTSPVKMKLKIDNIFVDVLGDNGAEACVMQTRFYDTHFKY
jgi:hypothetical protein